jgi:hypothetical protein
MDAVIPVDADWNEDFQEWFKPFLKILMLPTEHILVFISYNADSGHWVSSGRRQSMPSSSIDNWAGVNAILPSVACGQMKRRIRSDLRHYRIRNAQAYGPVKAVRGDWPCPRLVHVD